MKLWIALFTLFSLPLFASQIQQELPSQKTYLEAKGVDVTSGLEALEQKRATLAKSQNLMRQLNEVRDINNRNFSRLLREVYDNKSKPPTKAQVEHLEKFLKQASSFRNKDGSISLRTTRALLKADPKFSRIQRLDKTAMTRLVHIVRDYDVRFKQETRTLKSVNEYRKKADLKPIKGFKPTVVKSIVTNQPEFLVRDSIRDKRIITEELLKSGKFKSKAEIQAAVKAKDPRVAQLTQLDRRIRYFQRQIDNRPVNQVKAAISSTAKDAVHAAKQSPAGARVVSYLNKVPASEGMVDVLRSERMKIYNEIREGGKLNSWKQVRAEMANLKNNDPKIIRLRELDLQIQKARYEIKMSKLPSIEKGPLAKQWSSLNKEIVDLRNAKNYAKQSGADAETMRNVKLVQRRAYLKQAQLKLQHQLIADGSFKSVRAINSAIQDGKFTDPRMKSLSKIAKAQTDLQPKITRSIAGKVGYLKSQYKENSTVYKVGQQAKKTVENVKQAGKTITDKASQVGNQAKAMAANSSKTVQQAAQGAVKQVANSWNYTKEVSAKGVETIRAKASDGVEYTKTKAKNGWEVAKIKTKDGWEWSKARSKDSMGWAKNKADSGWKFVGDKTKALSAFTSTKVNQASNTAIESIRAGKQLAGNKAKAGWEYTKGKTSQGAQYIKAKSVDGWEYAKVKTEKGWQVTRVKTGQGWEWSRARSQDLAGWTKGKADAGWKFAGDKAKATSQFVAKGRNGLQNWSVEKAQMLSSKATAAKNQTKAAWEYTKDMGKRGIQSVQARSSDGWNYTKAKVDGAWQVTKVKTADGWEWSKARSKSAIGWAKGQGDAGWKFVGKNVKSISNLAQAKTQAAANLVVEQARAGKAAAAGKLKAGWEYTQSKTADGASLVKAKSVDGWEYTKQKVGKAYQVTKIKTADGWEWSKARSKDAAGYAKGKADAGWKFIGNKASGVKQLALSAGSSVKKGAVDLRNLSIEKVRSVASASTNAVKGTQEMLLGKAKGAWEITKTSTKNGVQSIHGKTTDGWEFVKNKTKTGWEMAKVKTSDGWTWTRQKAGDAMGWAKGTADKGWKFAGNKAAQVVDGTKNVAAKVDPTKAATAIKGKIDQLNKDIKASKGTPANDPKLKKRIALKETLQKEYKRLTSNAKKLAASAKPNKAPAAPKNSSSAKAPKNSASAKALAAPSSSANAGTAKPGIITRIGQGFVNGSRIVGGQIATGASNAGQFAYKGAQNGAEFLKGQSIKAFEFTKAKVVSGAQATGQAIQKGYTQGSQALSRGYAQGVQAVRAGTQQTIQVAKNTGSYISNRIQMGQRMAGHTWVSNSGKPPVIDAKTGMPVGAKPVQAQSVKVDVATKGATAPKAAVGSGSTLLGRLSSTLGLNSSGGAATTPKPGTGSTPGVGTTPKPGTGSNPGAGTTPKPGTGTTPGAGQGGVKGALKPVQDLGQSIAKSIGSLKGKNPVEIVKHVGKVGNAAVDKYLPSKADPNTGRDGYQVRRDNIATALKGKIDLLNQDIAKMRANGVSEAKINKRVALRDALNSEYNKSQISQQGINLQNQIKNLDASIAKAKKAGVPKAELDALKAAKTKAEGDLTKLKGDSKAVSRNYVRDGLKFAVTSAAIQGLLNLVDQVRSGEDVNLGNAFEFVTTPQFVMGTSGAFAGGLVVQKLMTTGIGKIALASVQNVLPGFLKPLAQILPYTIGAMVGSDLLSGQLGQRDVGSMLAQGVGSSIGMMLGGAIFPPVGAIVGGMVGSMVADKLFGAVAGEDEEQMAVRMLYEPHWLEFSELAYDSEDQIAVAEALGEDVSATQDSEFDDRINDIVDNITDISELEEAKKQAYDKYTQAVSEHGADHHTSSTAYVLYKKVAEKLVEARMADSSGERASWEVRDAE